MLYIGLNGYIGSGKDTVAKMLKVILNNHWESKDAAKAFYKEYFKRYRYATTDNDADKYCTCIAFADQLKKICSLIFGIPIDRFYYNKSNSWVCINKDFEYTEYPPFEDHIISADEYYAAQDKYSNSADKYYMSLRDILVYVGTYVCQEDINRQIFVNIVNNVLNGRIKTNNDLRYIICTDVRFEHEYDFIRRHSGVMINISRDSVEQENNIAEHDLDGFDEDNFDYTIYNNDSYDDLFDTVWDMVQSIHEFNDNTVKLCSRSNDGDNFLRDMGNITEGFRTYKLCTSRGLIGIHHEGDIITYIDPAGGPLIELGMPIPGTSIIPAKIMYDSRLNCYFIHERL